MKRGVGLIIGILISALLATAPPEVVEADPAPERPWSLARARQHRGLSQVDLAVRLGVAHATIAEWEGTSGRIRPVADRVRPAWIPVAVRVGRILHVDPFAIVECRRVVRPAAEDLPPPRSGRPDCRVAMLPFVHWLRGVLADQLWTLADLAEQIGASVGTVQDWANGASAPNRTQRRALVDLLPHAGLMDYLDAWADVRHHPVPGAKRGWTEDEETYLLAHPNTPASILAAVLGRTATAVSNHRLRLVKRRQTEA